MLPDKADQRPPKGAWAPGVYHSTCVKCTTIFVGDKRACECAPCAYGDRKGDWSYSYSGRQYWALDPRPEDFHIEDIAHALSNQCRFAGHCLEFYSVAQHCVIVSEQLCIPGHKLWGLLHDASEAYLTDVPHPLKYCLPDYMAAEAATMRMLAARFCMSWPEPPRVKDMDLRLLATERRDLMNPLPLPWECLNGVEPLNERIIPWTPAVAKRAFLECYEGLRISFPNLP